MKIISFGINNFRWISGWIEKNKLNFNESNTIFLLWQNNVWKSTFLRAYEFFYKNTSPSDDDLFSKNVDNLIEFELELKLDDFDFEKDAIKSKAEWLRSWLNSDSVLKIRRTFVSKMNWEKIKIEAPENFTFSWTKNEWEEKNYWGIWLDTVFQSSLPHPIFIKAMPTEEEVENIINDILSKKAEKALEDKERAELKAAQVKIRELQDKMYNPVSIQKYKDEVNNHFWKLFPETQIELEEKDKTVWSESKFWKKFAIHFEKKNPDGTINKNIPSSYAKIWHGAIRSAIFSLMLMKDIAEEFERSENRKDYLVLFEEPELFLHPRLMKELRALIYKVSEDDYPYQILCASHSPQMIDISKPKSSLIRLIKDSSWTKVYQIDDSFLKASKNIATKEQLKNEMYEVLRFNPFLCESFYADEVILIEWPTEEIILRWYLWEKCPMKDVFIVNCGTVNNIPFYQKIFSKFSIKYNIICDTDNANYDGIDANWIKKFTSWIQKTIYEQYILDKDNGISLNFCYHEDTFEPAHKVSSIPEKFRYKDTYNISDWKPYNANLYWRDVLAPNLEDESINLVPIISFIKKIT